MQSLSHKTQRQKGSEHIVFGIEDYNDMLIATATSPAIIELDPGSETEGAEPSQAEYINNGAGQYQFYRIPL